MSLPRSRDLRSQSTAAAVPLSKLSQLIAIGNSSFPADLSQDELSRLQGLVRQIRRQRLLTLVAKAIAADIAKNQKNPKKDQ